MEGKIYFGADTGSTGVRGAVASEEFEGIGEYSNYVAPFDIKDKQDPKKKINENATFVDTLLLGIHIKPRGKVTNDGASKMIQSINATPWLCGNVAKNIATNPTQLKPNVRKNKQIELYINAISAFTCLMKEHDISEAHSAHLRLLLPPTEYKEDEATAMISSVLNESVITITNIITDEEFVIHVDSIDFRSEGQAAMAYALVDEDGNPTELAPKVKESNFILFDCGENTLDIIRLEKGAIVGGKVKTLSHGSKFTMGHLAELIENQYKFQPSPDDLRTVFEKGSMQIGGRNVDVQSLISSANREYVNHWYPEFDRYLITNKLPLQSIAGFIFVGGASKKSGEATTSLGDAFKAQVYQIVEGIPIFTPKDPRRANILGLLNQLRAMRDMAVA